MKKSKKKMLPASFLLLAAVLLLLYVILVKPNFHLFQGGAVFLEPVDVRRFDANDTVSVYSYGSNIYSAGKNGLEKRNVSGETIWSKAYTVQTPQLVMDQGYMAVGDLSGKKAFLFNEEGFLHEFTVSWPIVLLRVNSSGFLVIVQESGETHLIQMYDKEGKLLAERGTSFKNDGYPVALDISSTAMDWVTSYAYIRENRMQSKLSFFNFEAKSSNLEEYITGGFLEEDLLAPAIRFMDDAHVFVGSDKKLLFFELDRIPKQLEAIEVNNRVMDIAYTDKHVVVQYGEALGTEGEGHRNTVVFYNTQGKEVQKFQPEEEVKSIFADQDTLYVVSASRLTAFYGTRPQWFSSIHREVSRVFHLGGKNYLMVYPQGYEVVRIRES
ncbi:DUF5711 family protein [Anaerotalea alkaliphila]|uniref:Uncharacterized protein n=1 Tax=Anaerotalea alkaliphila TaxID=2662126 RepID=A0A7X5KNQ7_9FIRM|nr:DUF5711 family protein [Anaerotalea alkaliphila]NDL68058.1 hypothetical protein [Anaerotalea alkaliphila]